MKIITGRFKTKKTDEGYKIYQGRKLAGFLKLRRTCDKSFGWFFFPSDDCCFLCLGLTEIAHLMREVDDKDGCSDKD